MSRLLLYINEPGSERIDPTETFESIKYALEKGIMAFHVSSSDKDGIASLGAALKEWSGKSPKISLGIGEIGTGTTVSAPGIFNNDSILKTIDQSLYNIGIEMIDMLVLNDPPVSQLPVFPEIIDSINDLQIKGIIGFKGIGCYRPGEIESLIRGGYFDFLWGMNRLNACNLDALQGEIQLLQEAGMGYLNSSVLHMSLLGNRLGQYSRERPESTLVSERDISVAVMASRIAARNNMTITEMAYRYAFSTGESGIVALSTGDRLHMQELIESWIKGPLSKELFDSINSNTISFYR